MPDESQIAYIEAAGKANSPPTPRGFYACLDRIRENPALYLGDKLFCALGPWIWGYNSGRRDAGLEMSDEEIEFRGFHEFVRKKYGLAPTSHGWQSRIRYMFVSDENAFDEFFRLLDEFRESKRRAREREAKRAAKAEKEKI